jgi:8-oxo-dGTP diphosphatase
VSHGFRPATGVPLSAGERRHVAVHLDGPAAAAVDGLRALHDPEMRRIAPPHVTLVYPEETGDAALLLRRLEREAAETAPIPLRLGAFAGVDDGRGGVHAAVADPAGALEALRDRLLLPPQRFSGYPFHATIAHPRTATAPAGCWTALRGGGLDVPFTAREALWTATDGTGRRVLRRFPFTGPPVPRRTATAAGVLVRHGRVLLGLRHRDRASYPGVWDLPGGHVEPGESPRAALRRELREELGVAVTPGAPWRVLTDDAAAAELWLWPVREWDGEVTNAAADEHERLGWFTAAELGALDLALPEYRPLLAAALAGA